MGVSRGSRRGQLRLRERLTTGGYNQQLHKEAKGLGVELAQLQTETEAMAALAVALGQCVECRDSGEAWEAGEVTCLCPLKVKRKSEEEGKPFDEVRAAA